MARSGQRNRTNVATRGVCAAALGLVTLLSIVGCGRGPLPHAAAPDMVEALKLRASLQKADSVSEDANGVGDVPEPTGFVSLKGSFKLIGTAPALGKVTTMSADCRGITEEVPIEDLVVDPQTNGIANILVMADITHQSWIHESAKQPAQPEAVFDQAKCNFKTHLLGVQTGQTLKILNSDPFGHNTKFDPRSNNPLNQTITEAGVTYRPEKSEKDPFAVSCSIHPWMKAYMIFRDNGYFAVTKPDGTFEIANLPAGVPVNFRVWQEKSKGLPSATVKSPSSLAGKPFKKGKFTLTLDAGDPAANQLDVEVDLASFQ